MADAPPCLSGSIRAGRHVLAVRVYYEDTDFSGVVYHAAYLRFMERGRTDYLRLQGIDHRTMFEATQGKGGPGFAFVVRAMQIEFIRPARMDDLLEIWTEPQDVAGASALLRQRVMRDGAVLIEAGVRIACVSGSRPQRLPTRLRQALEADRALAPRAGA